MLSSYYIHGDSANYELHFSFLGDVNGFMYFDAMKQGDNWFKNIIKTSFPVPTNETFSAIRFD